MPAINPSKGVERKRAAVGIRAAIGVAIVIQVVILRNLAHAHGVSTTEAPAAGVPAITQSPAARAAPQPPANPATRPTPRFGDFPAVQTFTGKPAPVDLNSHPEARRFRTVLRRGASEGPNFAGDQTVVTWGCGTECQVVAIVDARSGRVVFPGIVSELGVDFRRDSLLLIENPPDALVVEGSEADPKAVAEQARIYGGPNFYVWNGASLVTVLADETVGLTFPAWAR